MKNLQEYEEEIEKEQQMRWGIREFIRTIKFVEFDNKISATITWRGLDVNYIGKDENKAVQGLFKKIKRWEKSIGISEWNKYSNLEIKLIKEKDKKIIGSKMLCGLCNKTIVRRQASQIYCFHCSFKI